MSMSSSKKLAKKAWWVVVSEDASLNPGKIIRRAKTEAEARNGYTLFCKVRKETEAETKERLGIS